MTAAPVICGLCFRSCWLCPGGEDCASRPDDIHGDAPPIPQENPMMDEVCIRRYTAPDGSDREEWLRNDGVDFTRSRASSLAEWRVISMTVAPVPSVLSRVMAQAVCEVVSGLLVAFSPCSSASHVAAMSRRPSGLEYRGIDGDTVLMECGRCKAPVPMTREQALAASAPIEMATHRQRRARRDTSPTVEIPVVSTAELHAAARAGVWK